MTDRQAKTTPRYHFSHSRLAEKKKNPKAWHILWAKLCRNRYFYTLLLGVCIGTVSIKGTWCISELQMHASFNPAIFTLKKYFYTFEFMLQICFHMLETHRGAGAGTGSSASGGRVWGMGGRRHVRLQKQQEAAPKAAQ